MNIAVYMRVATEEQISRGETKGNAAVKTQ